MPDASDLLNNYYDIVPFLYPERRMAANLSFDTSFYPRWMQTAGERTTKLVSWTKDYYDKYHDGAGDFQNVWALWEDDKDGTKRYFIYNYRYPLHILSVYGETVSLLLYGLNTYKSESFATNVVFETTTGGVDYYSIRLVSNNKYICCSPETAGFSIKNNKDKSCFWQFKVSQTKTDNRPTPYNFSKTFFFNDEGGNGYRGGTNDFWFRATLYGSSYTTNTPKNFSVAFNRNDYLTLEADGGSASRSKGARMGGLGETNGDTTPIMKTEIVLVGTGYDGHLLKNGIWVRDTNNVQDTSRIIYIYDPADYGDMNNIPVKGYSSDPPKLDNTMFWWVPIADGGSSFLLVGDRDGVQQKYFLTMRDFENKIYNGSRKGPRWIKVEDVVSDDPDRPWPCRKLIELSLQEN